MNVTAASPLARTTIGRLSVPFRMDPALITGRVVGKHAGYESADAAISALRGATTGNFAAAGVLELNGRYHGFQVDSRNGWLDRLLNVRDVEGTWPNTRARPVPYSDPLHLTDVVDGERIRFTDARFVALVDGDVVLRPGSGA